VQTYLQRDVRDLAQVADLGAFGRFLALVGARSGCVLNMAELSREVGISGPTAKRWLSILETSQLVFLLKPYHRNYGKRLRKSPKLYLLDPGLVTFLLGLHTKEAVLQGPSLGALAETAVVCEWLKACRQLGEQPGLYYWQSSTVAEVDLIVDRAGILYAIEVKATATPTPHHAAGLARWLELAGPSARAALACRVEQPQVLRPGIRAIPWHLAW
jgi:predicted AAA+ superfamily ATPase